MAVTTWLTLGWSVGAAACGAECPSRGRPCLLSALLPSRARRSTFTTGLLRRSPVLRSVQCSLVMRPTTPISEPLAHVVGCDLGQAHESALKEAETDAMKRALMTFGNPFGLALYDKQQREVTSSATPASNANPSSRPAEAAPRQQPQSPAQQDPDPGLAPLDPGTIQQLLATVRGLPRPALEGFTKAFRKRFQVPEEAASIADRICQRRHHDWIETFLVSHR